MENLTLRKVRVEFPRPVVHEIEQTLFEGFNRHRSLFKPGASIAVGVGSRGIANIARIARATVAWLKAAGTVPFIFPAMGSHGGATAEGQRKLIASFGITEETVQCPIRATMETIELPNDRLPHRLFMDRFAHDADGIVLINRVKPHTDFHGRHESGLAKMAVIGMGKEKQAVEMHRFGVKGLREYVPIAAARILALGKVLAGVAVVENACDETAKIEVLNASEIMEREPALLEEARSHLPRLPVAELDVLIVDRLGKDVSGTGMDTNVIGRMRIPGEPEPESPRIRAIVLDAVTDGSHGNATGMGLADVVTRRFFNGIDFQVTYKNIITSSFLERGKLPLVAETAAEAFACALRSCGVIPPGRERVIRIRDTLHLAEIHASDAVCEELKSNARTHIDPARVELFDETGGLRPWA